MVEASAIGLEAIATGSLAIRVDAIAILVASLLLIVRPGAPSCVLAARSKARSP